MPITIAEPLPGGAVGIGLNVHAVTSLPGPVGPDDHWHLILTHPEDTNKIVGRARKQFTTPTVDLIVGQMDGVYTSDLVQHPTVSDGQPVRLILELINGVDGHIMDSGQVTAVHDRRTGVPNLITTPTQGQGAFTEDDRLVLQQVQGGLLSILADVFLEPVLDWLSQYLPQAWQPISYGAALCEPGFLTRPDLAPLNKWVGIRWTVTQYPSGLGIVEGNPDHSYASWGQISLTKLHDDGEAHVYDTRYEARLDGSILWGSNEPFNVQVYMLPGVCVSFAALTAPPWAPGRTRVGRSTTD